MSLTYTIGFFVLSPHRHDAEANVPIDFCRIVNILMTERQKLQGRRDRYRPEP